MTARGPAIAHDEYGPDHEGYGLFPDGGADGHGLAPGEYGVVYDDYGLSRERAASRKRVIFPNPAPPGPTPGLPCARPAPPPAGPCWAT